MSDNNKLSSHVQSWVGNVNDDETSIQQQEKPNHLKYIKKYSKMFSKTNVYKAIHRAIKTNVQEVHGMSITDAINYVLLDFISADNPISGLESLRSKHSRKMTEIEKDSMDF